MTLNHFSCNGQAGPRPPSILILGVQAFEDLKNSMVVLRVNANAVVLNVEHVVILWVPRAAGPSHAGRGLTNTNGTVGRIVVAHGVGKQIDQDLLHPNPVAAHGGQRLHYRDGGAQLLEAGLQIGLAGLSFRLGSTRDLKVSVDNTLTDFGAYPLPVFGPVGVFALTFALPIVTERFGLQAVFGAFAAFGVLVTLFLWRFLPNTSGRSLEELEETWRDQAPAHGAPAAGASR